MKILVSNVGSTSLKFKLYDMPSERVLCEAKVERVGSDHDAIYTYKDDARSEKREGCSVPGYTEGIRLFLADMAGVAEAGNISAVGFKTVLAKGYYGVHELTDEVLAAMREWLFVAPAHNGPYLEAIGCFREVMPWAKLVGVFETAFHTTIPPERTLFAVPYEWYEKYGVKRMGYHGASHSYVADTLTARFGGTGRTVSCHLGGSCSLCAIEDGRSVDTSFGFSLQTGVMHANRTGDLDPYVLPFLLNQGMSMDEALDGLAKRGGLLGVSGVGPKAALAILSASNPQAFTLAILTGDEKALTRAPGIGNKLAQRILLELKDKLGSLEASNVSDAAVPGPVTPGNAASEAAAALEVLGYGPSEIAVAMRGIDPALPTDEMVRLALRNMLAK